VYLGFLLALPVFLLRGKRRAASPTGPFLAGACLAWFAFCADAAGGFFGLWDAPAALRFALGMGASVSLCPYVALLFHSTMGTGRRPGAIANGWALLWLGVSVAMVSVLNLAPSIALLKTETLAAGGGGLLLLWVAHAAILALLLGPRWRRAAFAVAPVTALAQVTLFSLLRSLSGL
jgi:hypothetical protein